MVFLHPRKRRFVASDQTAPKRAWLGLSCIIAASAAVSTYWVFLVPIFQSPDEPAHMDYAFNLYTARRLISSREPWLPCNSHLGGTGPWRETVVHVYTLYLRKASNMEAIRFQPDAKVPEDYGTASFFAALDRDAPDEVSGDAAGESRSGREGWPGIGNWYPYGYYAAAAAWMRFVHLFSSRLTVLFFGGRIFSVILLAFSLLLVYAVTREIGLNWRRALLYTAIVGLFPLTSFVSSYVQPDNLGLTLVLLCCYLATVVRRRPDDARWLVLLGVSLGLLCITKYHYYLCVLAGILGMLVTTRMSRQSNRIGWFRTVAVVMLPTVTLLSVQAWITWGSHVNPILDSPDMRHAEASEAWSRGAMSTIGFLLDGLRGAFDNFYLSGSTFTSFWGCFGWLDAPLEIVSPEATRIIKTLLAMGSVAVFGLTVWRLGQVTTRLILVARRGRARQALAIMFSNPLLNSYFLFFLFMFLLFDVTRGAYVPQGRNWFPFILPIFLVGTWYAPRALGHRVARAWVSMLLNVFLLLYCIVGGYYSIQTVTHRYYLQ